MHGQLPSSGCYMSCVSAAHNLSIIIILVEQAMQVQSSDRVHKTLSCSQNTFSNTQ